MTEIIEMVAVEAVEVAAEEVEVEEEEEDMLTLMKLKSMISVEAELKVLETLFLYRPMSSVISLAPASLSRCFQPISC